jgi:putative NADPH-quinone reductase
MHTLLVFDHPYGATAHDNVPHRRSFSAALLAAALEGSAQAGHTTDVIDLGADGFDPVVSADDLRAWRQDTAVDPVVLDYQRRLAAADHLVLVHPIYWMVMPAGTKGFLDRVLTRGFAFGERTPGALLQRRLMRLRRVTILSPLTTPLPFYRTLFGAPAVRTLATGTFRLIGIPTVRWHGFAGMAQRTPAQRRRALDGVSRRFARLR